MPKLIATNKIPPLSNLPISQGVKKSINFIRVSDDNSIMKFIVATLITLKIFATDYTYTPIYENTGWSGKIVANQNNYQKRLYECAHSNSLSRQNFVSHNSGIGFISKKNNKKGISFLSNDGKHKFLAWDAIPKDKNKIAFTLGDSTYIGYKTDEEWRFDDYKSKEISLKDEFLITLPEENLTKDQEGDLFAETNKSLDILNNSKNEKKITDFFSNNLLACLKTASINKDKNFISSINLLAKASSEMMMKDFDKGLIKVNAPIKADTNSGIKR